MLPVYFAKSFIPEFMNGWIIHEWMKSMNPLHGGTGVLGSGWSSSELFLSLLPSRVLKQAQHFPAFPPFAPGKNCCKQVLSGEEKP